MSKRAPLVEGFAELTLASREPERLADFYRDVFGMRRLADERDRVWLDAGRTARLGIWLPGEKEFGDRGGVHVHFALSVAPRSLDGLAARARAAGASCEGPVEHDGGDRSLYMTDPEGNRVEAWDLFARGSTVDRLEDD
jgi:catechol-2,3-dioxygenase